VPASPPNGDGSEAPLFGAIEAGGTKWICALGHGGGELIDLAVIPTGAPAPTLAAAVEFFAERSLPVALGIASFGPIELDTCEPGFGRIGATTKPGWEGTDVVKPLRDAFGIPVSLDTDVNAAALAEWRRGAGVGTRSLAYITVGTGIGAGYVVGGALLRGDGHPEFGHIRVPHDPNLDGFEGACRYHRDCLEGLASGEALRRRWGTHAEQLQSTEAWQLEAHYLGLAISNLIYTLAPERIVLGGGVMARPGLLALVRRSVAGLVAGYGYHCGAAKEPGRDGGSSDPDDKQVERLIVAPALGGFAGLHGGIELAADLHAERLAVLNAAPDRIAAVGS
jgi:fructokinase